MTADLALANLLSRKSKTVISMAGVATSIVLIFMQLGFRGAVENTATMIYDELEFDLVIRSPDYLHIADTSTIDRNWCAWAQGHPGVRHARPMWVGFGNWKNPRAPSLHGILILGMDPRFPIFASSEISDQTQQLLSTSNILVDRETSRDFGPHNGKRFSFDDVGITTTVNEEPVRIAGTFEIGAGLTANGSMIVGQTHFGRLVPIPINREISMGLVRVEPGAQVEQVRDRLREALQQQQVSGTPIEVLTREEVETRELRRWIRETPIGFIFSLGVAISFLVGSAIVFSVMSNDVSRRMGEFATLKAMGYSNGVVCSIVLRQAAYLGILAFVPALLIAMLIYAITAQLANIPIEMTWERAIFVLVLSLAMSCLSGLASLRRVWSADPAALF